LFTNTANMSGVLAAPITTGLTTVRLWLYISRRNRII
jgi:hypothetical protein